MTRIGKIQLGKEGKDKKLMTRGGNKRVKKKEKWNWGWGLEERRMRAIRIKKRKLDEISIEVFR